MRARLFLLLALAALAVPVVAWAADRARGDAKPFARVPDPGAPAPVLIGPDGMVWTATLNAESGKTDQPSKVFGFDASGKLVKDFTVTGQPLGEQHGLTGMAMDGEGRLYVASINPPAVLRLDAKTGKQETYAQLRDVPVCGPSIPDDCSKGLRDLTPWPDYVVFTADGTMYVTDSYQALIWRVPPGGGKGEVWLTDDRLQSLTGSPGFGPSAMKLMPDKKTLMFTTVEGPTGDGDPSAGRIWTVPIGADGKPGELKQFWVASSADAPGGMVFAKSGKIYVALSGPSQIAVLSPEGKELERFPDPATNAGYEIPLDAPVDMASRGDSLIVANSGFLSNSPQSFALLDVYIGEGSVVEQPHPPLAGKTVQKRLKLAVSPTKVKAGKRVRMRFRVTDGSSPVRGAEVRVGKQHVKTRSNGRASIVFVSRRPGKKRVTARRQGYLSASGTVTVSR